MAKEITDWLINNSPEIKEIVKFPDDKRIISKVVFNCSLMMNKKSKKIQYVWGEYSLREQVYLELSRRNVIEKSM